MAPHLAYKKASAQTPHSTFIQPKLMVNAPNDIFEQEADAMAERVMRMPANGNKFGAATGIIGASIQRKCTSCEEEEKKKKPVMRKTETGYGGVQASDSLVSSLHATRGGGSSLSPETMGFMENAFSADFSAVRIHTGEKATGLNKDIRAKAFTSGSDIYFNNGEYSPDTTEGKKLLAHELTHVVQHERGSSVIQRTIELRPPGRREASAFGRVQELIDRLNGLSTALQYRLEGNTLLYEVVDEDAMTNFDTQLKGFIDQSVIVPLRLVPSTSQVIADSFWLGYVDLDDLMASDDVGFQSQLLHFLAERFNVNRYAQRIGTEGMSPIDLNTLQVRPFFNRAHDAGHQAQVEHFRDIFNDSSIIFNYEEAKPSGNAHIVFKSRLGRYRIFLIMHGAIRTPASRVRATSEGTVKVLTSDGVWHTVEEFLASRASQAAPAIQPKLMVNKPGDIYEQEADAMAERVMRMPSQATLLQANAGLVSSSVQRKCATCEEEEKRRKPIMRKAEAGNSGMSVSSSFASTLNASKGAGSPLPLGTRSFMENAFRTDFSGVRVHTDSQASEMNMGINAKAFTHGSDIYFNSGQFDTRSAEGNKLLAHELTHVVQQFHLGGTSLQRTSQAASVNRALGLGPMFNYYDAYLVLSPLNSTDLIDTLVDLHNSNSGILQLLIDNISGVIGPIGVDRLTIYLLGVKNALLQNRMSSTELNLLATLITTLPLDQQQAIHSFISSHRTDVTRDLYSGTHLPTATEQGTVETILNPGATVSAPIAPGAPVTITLARPNPVCSSVAGFSSRVRAVLAPQITSRAAAFRTRRASGANFPIASANSMADLAQNESENYFRPYLARASRSGVAGTYSIGGSIRASAMLRDQSTTPIWRTPAGRLGWLKYWYDHQTGNMNDTLNCDPTQIETALNTMATDATLIPDIDDYINSWPAEATGGINIQPYLDATQLVCQRWDTFTTIIHEFIHLLAHPNFQNAERTLPNNGLEILKEGLDDVLRKELWEGAGNLKANLISSARNTDRAIIEGGAYPLQLSKVCSHSYYDNLPEAERLTNVVGRNNIKLAYFLGQTEYLGLGTGSSTTTPGALSTISFYRVTDALDQDIVTVIPGETRDQLLLRTNGNQIRDIANNVLPAASPLPASVRIPGVRKVYVHTNDSIISIAVQNGVSPYEILRANNLTTTSVVVGSRLIIPRH